MKIRTIIGVLLVFALVLGSIGAVSAFVDEDGDGICDNYPGNGNDADEDGIPNGQDDDYVSSPKDGNGYGACTGCVA